MTGTGYKHKDPVSCFVAGDHLSSCDDDGYCNSCGYQDDPKEEVLLKLQSGMHYMCVRRDDPNLPWLLEDPRIDNSGIVQADEQSSYIDFWWKENQ